MDVRLSFIIEAINAGKIPEREVQRMYLNGWVSTILVKEVPLKEETEVQQLEGWFPLVYNSWAWTLPDGSYWFGPDDLQDLYDKKHSRFTFKLLTTNDNSTN